MKRKTRIVIGVALRVVLAVVIMTTITVGFWMYWYYKTDLDLLYFIASYLGFGMSINILIISIASDSISKFCNSFRRKSRKHSRRKYRNVAA